MRLSAKAGGVSCTDHLIAVQGNHYIHLSECPQVRLLVLMIWFCFLAGALCIAIPAPLAQ